MSSRAAQRNGIRVTLALLLGSLFTVAGMPTAQAITPPIQCAAGKMPLRFNGKWHCVPAAPSTVTGVLNSLAESLSSPSLLSEAGAKGGAVALDQDHRSVLRTFYAQVLLKAWAVSPPAIGHPKKVVTFSFPGGKFDGFPVRASETLRPPTAGAFGSPRSTSFAIALQGKLPSATEAGATARTSGSDWVKVNDNTSVRSDQCPNSDGVLHIDAKGSDVVTFSVNGNVSQVTGTVESATTVFVDDHANVYMPIEQKWHATFSPDTGFRADAQQWHYGSGQDVSVMTVTDHGAPVPFAVNTFVDLNPLGERVQSATNRALQQAKTYWESGKCLDASFSPSAPDPLKPNQQLQERVTIRRRDNQNPVAKATLTPTVSPGGSVTPSKAVTDSSGNVTFTITAPGSVQNPLILHVQGVSRQGVVKGDLPICMESATAPLQSRTTTASGDVCTPPQPFFRVESWSSTETAVGSEDSLMCDTFGVDDQAKGTLDVGTSLPTPQASAPADNTLTSLGGHIFMDGVHETFSNYTAHNCSFDSQTGQEVPCDHTLPDHTVTDLQDGIGLTPSGSSVTVTWPLIGANLGGVDELCAVFFGNNVSFAEMQGTAPLATFQTPGEHTLTFSGSKHFTEDSLHQPASIDYTWSFTITFEVVSTHG
jgi:hypothetical protein